MLSIPQKIFFPDFCPEASKMGQIKNKDTLLY